MALIQTLCLILCVIITSCGNHTKPDTLNENLNEGRILRDLTILAGEYTDSILTSMTLEEMAGQCLMPSIPSTYDSITDSILKKYIEDYHIGGVVLMKGDSKAVKKICELCGKSRIPMFIAIDAEWGLGMRLDDGDLYPKNGRVNKSMGDIWQYDYGREIARVSREIGINMILGPVLDVAEKNRGVIGARSYGEDPALVSELGVAYAKGLESGGVMSVAKHFPGHGSSVYDSHKGLAKVNKNINVLDSVDLKPFREYINSGLSGIMAGHIQALSLDPGGVPASVSIDMLTSLLRDEMGFKGLILTDAFDMGGAKGFSAVEALKAGADIVLCPENLSVEYNGIMNSLKDNVIDINVLRERCRKILFYKYLFAVKAGNSSQT